MQNKNIKFLSVFFYFLLFILNSAYSVSLCIAASDITAKATIDKKDIFIGDKIRYNIEVVAPRDIMVEFPQFAENLGGFTIKDFGGKQKKNFFKKEVRYEQWYILDTYLTGKYQIPASNIRYKTVLGKEGSISTETISVEIKSLLELE